MKTSNNSHIDNFKCVLCKRGKKHEIFKIPPSGAPVGFCDDHETGTYQHPAIKNKFFSCVHGSATPCHTCPAGLIYVEVCKSCLRKHISKFCLSLSTSIEYIMIFSKNILICSQNFWGYMTFIYKIYWILSKNYLLIGWSLTILQSLIHL